MKKLQLLGCMLIFVVGLVGMVSQAPALSVLEQDGQKVVYDEVHNKYWYWDMSAFTSMNYGSKVQAISVLNEGEGYFGVDGWHMANVIEMQALWDVASPQERLEVFFPSYVDNGPRRLYGIYGVYDEVVPGSYPGHYNAWVERRLWLTPPYQYVQSNIGDDDWSGDQSLSSAIGAWVVTEAQTPVPEPGTMLLLGSGLIGVLALCRKKPKHR